MRIYDLAFCIIYSALALFELIGMVDLNDKVILGMTLGSLGLCIVPLMKNNKAKKCLFILSLAAIIAFQYIVNIDKYIKGFDGNIFMLISLAVIFLTNYLNYIENEKSKKEVLKKDIKSNIERKREINKLTKEYNCLLEDKTYLLEENKLLLEENKRLKKKLLKFKNRGV
ncbi:hypothetical protein ACSXDC_00860 [Clostridium perfringens]|nr:hypothetical protein [Clostridium perfringens]